jgi:hypothetical protein
MLLALDTILDAISSIICFMTFSMISLHFLSSSCGIIRHYPIDQGRGGIVLKGRNYHVC